MEKKIALLFEKDAKDLYDGYETIINLIPKKIVMGCIDEKGYFVSEDNVKFKCADASESFKEELFYMFPISLETLVKEFYGSDEIDITEDNISEEITTYFFDATQSYYYLKYGTDKSKLTCYMYDYNDYKTDIVDPNDDFYTIVKKIEKSNTLDIDCGSYENSVETFVETPEFSFDIDFKKLYTLVTKTVVAQDDQIREILVALKKHYESKDSKMTANILMVGPTGVGKTEIMSLIANNLDVPIAIVDSTQFTQEGYVGRSVEQSLKQLYDNAKGDLNKAQKGMLIFDEIDKKAVTGKETVATKAVLDSLLKILDGTDCYVQGIGQFNTSKVVFAGLGAFSGILPESKEKKVMGFVSETEEKDVLTYKNNLNQENFIKYGFSPEFMGRINKLVLLNHLTIDDLINILLNSDKSALKPNVELLKDYGVLLSYHDKAIEEIAKEAYKTKSGARALNQIVNGTLDYAFYEIFSSENKYKELIITEETVHDPKVYTLK